MLRDYSVGIILFIKENSEIKYLILKHKPGHWTFCKGHPNKDEEKHESARRELLEEAGISNISFLFEETIAEQEYIIRNPDNSIFKKVEFFIAEAFSREVKIDNKEIVDYVWLNFAEAKEKITFAGTKEILENINDIIIKNVK
jgi:bis(5'-nucleosidyl)-tetraphosphatase